MDNNPIIELLSSGGKISTKRVVTVSLLILIGICSLVELFAGLKVSESTFNALTFSFDASVATVLAEQFSRKNNDKRKDDEQTIPNVEH